MLFASESRNTKNEQSCDCTRRKLCWFGRLDSLQQCSGADPRCRRSWNSIATCGRSSRKNCYQCHGPERKAASRPAAGYAGRAAGRKANRARPFPASRSKRVAAAYHGDRFRGANAARQSGQATDGSRDRNSQALDRARCQLARTLVLPTARPATPGIDEPGFVHNPVDRFLLARLAATGFKHAPEADRRTLIRRLSFDLTGLPPTPEEVEAFVSGRAGPRPTRSWSIGCWPRSIIGERMAMYWLDLVRYADTGGYHSDNHRDVCAVPRLRHRRLQRQQAVRPVHASSSWPATCCPTPPASSGSPRATTGCCRPPRKAGAGQGVHGQVRRRPRAERVQRSGWRGTMGCCECHDHKFDPFTHEGLLQLRRVLRRRQREVAVGRQEQTKIPTARAERRELQQLEAQLADAAKQARRADARAGRRPGEVGSERQGRSGGRTLAERSSRPRPSRRAARRSSRTDDGRAGHAARIRPRKRTPSRFRPDDAKGITGMRLEALTDRAFPTRAWSRGQRQLRADRSSKWSRVAQRQVEAGQASPAAEADFSQPNYPSPTPSTARPRPAGRSAATRKPADHAAVFTLRQPIVGGRENEAGRQAAPQFAVRRSTTSAASACRSRPPRSPCAIRRAACRPKSPRSCRWTPASATTRRSKALAAYLPRHRAGARRRSASSSPN